MDKTLSTNQDLIPIQVCYASNPHFILLDIQVNKRTSLLQAIHQSGILKQIPEIEITEGRVGIFGKIKPLTTLLQAYDRIEIYHPLLSNPKETRKLRAEKQSFNSAKAKDAARHCLTKQAVPFQ